MIGVVRFCSVYSRMKDAKERGWRKITRMDINDHLNVNSPTSLIAPTKSKIIPTRVFRMVFTDSKTNDNLLPSIRGEAAITNTDMLHCIALVLECCARRVEKWREFALGSKSSKLSRRVLDGFDCDCDCE